MGFIQQFDRFSGTLTPINMHIIFLTEIIPRIYDRRARFENRNNTFFINYFLN